MLIAQLKHAPNRDFAFSRFLKNTRDGADLKIPIGKLNVWILGHLIGFISEEPKKFGIEILNNEKISQFNQILSQLDILLENQELFDGLLDRLVEYHNQHLDEDIHSKNFIQLQGVFTLSKPSYFDVTHKVGIPLALAGGALALEVLRRRKNRITLEKAQIDDKAKRARIEQEIQQKKKDKKVKK